MQIVRLRVENKKLLVPDGEVRGPTGYFMDIAVDEETEYAVPVDQTTYKSLMNISINETPTSQVG